MDMMKANEGDCGPIMDMFMDACESKTKNECTGKCEWHKNGDYEFDDTSKSCKEIPKCEEKIRDSNDPDGMAAMCPTGNTEAITKICDAKGTDQLKMECYGDKCPFMLMFVGVFSCAFSLTKDTCLSYGNLCTFSKDTKQCDMNMAYVFDLLIPKSCWMRPMIEDSAVCANVKTESACNKDKKCDWKTETWCDSELVQTDDTCEANMESVRG